MWRPINREKDPVGRDSDVVTFNETKGRRESGIVEKTGLRMNFRTKRSERRSRIGSGTDYDLRIFSNHSRTTSRDDFIPEGPPKIT